jgi:hypothetical protein
MSYYLLPKNNNTITIVPNIKTDDIKSYTSHSLYNFYNESKNKLKNMVETEESIITFKNLLKIINPYEYIFNKASGFKNSISKLKNYTICFMIY